MAKAVKQKETEKSEEKTALTVKKAFIDKHTNKKYEAGHDVSHFEEHRIKELKAKGIIE